MTNTGNGVCGASILKHWWNQQEVECRGRKIRVVLNGHLILDADLDQVAPDGKTIDGQDHPGLQNIKGHIGFLGHRDRVAFRKIRSRPLGAASANE